MHQYFARAILGVHPTAHDERGTGVIEGVHKVVVEVDDQDRALGFWTQTVGFQVDRDTAYGDERWLEVRTRDQAVTLILDLRRGERPTAPDELPTSNVFLYCDDLPGTYDDLRTRGVSFPQPPVEQSWGWWSIFEDQDGNRFALVPRDAR